jgi:S1-C subfamily serine protease
MTLAQDGSEAQIVGAEFLRGWLQESGTQGRTRDWIGDLGVAEQDLRAPALASWLGLDAPRGLLILSVEQGSSACGVLRRGDVLLSVDGHELDGDGNVRDPVRGLVAFEGLLAEFHPGEELPVRILRDKKVLDLRIPLRHYTGDSWLIPHGRLDPPPFLMAGGLVFREFDESYTARSTELRVAFQTARKAQQPERRRIVVLGTVLPDPFNLGYHQLSDLRVVAVNGQGVDSVDEVRAALQTPKDGYHVVEFQPNGRMNQLVLDAQGFEDATTRIAENYGLLETFRPSVPPPPLGDCKE